MVKRRSFTPEFKAKVVLEVISGSQSAAEACRQYSLKPQVLSRWKAEFVDNAARVFQSDEQLSQEQARIAELERLVGRQALELEVLKKASRLLASPWSRSEP
jgi:transposase-like protein